MNSEEFVSTEVLSESESAVLEEKLYNEIKEAVNIRQISDVPLGSFFFSGIDSSLSLLFIKKGDNEELNTFTVNFSEKHYDESKDAELVSDHLKTLYNITSYSDENLLKQVEDSLNAYDEPFADSSQIPTHLVSKAAREKVTV